MTVINKQKFLAELGKLLTFMYEEDRLAALRMYSEMYDDAESEEALSQFFMSPTRQAVVIARAYDAGARKLQSSSQAKEGTAEEAKYISVIENTRSEAVAKGFIKDAFAELTAPETEPEIEVTVEEVNEDQFSLFAEDAETAPEEEDAPTVVVDTEAEPAEEPSEATIDDDFAASVQDAPAPEESKPVGGSDEEINAFLEGFHIDDGSSSDEADEEETVPADVEEYTFAPDEQGVKSAELDAEPVMVRKPKVFLLILYILIAIPVTVAGVALLLIPTAALLALAAAAVGAGIGAMTAVFSGFAVIADILVVLGGALIVCALALLLVWTFIWFTIDVLCGFVALVFRLGRKWCYKEVPAV